MNILKFNEFVNENFIIKPIAKTKYYIRDFEHYNNDICHLYEIYSIDEKYCFLEYFSDLKKLYIFVNNYAEAGYSDKYTFMHVIADYYFNNKKKYKIRYESFTNGKGNRFVIEHNISKSELIKLAQYLFDHKDARYENGNMNDDMYGHMICDFINNKRNYPF